MLSEPIKQFIEINVNSRVLLLCKEKGISDLTVIKQHQLSLIGVLQAQAEEGADIASLGKTLNKELDNLSRRLAGEEIAETISQPQAPPSEPVEENEVASEAAVEETPVAKKPPKSTGYKPEAKAMTEKLAIARKPLSELLQTDCVAQNLLSPDRAKHWVHNMSGRVKEEVENEIVHELRGKVHNGVKAYIRKHKKDNPWSTPQLQEDLRLDFAAVRTVRGVLILSRQIEQEIEKHEAQSKPSILKRLFKKNTRQ